ncbi:hypothetical protein H4S03_009642 [Coemansia sp. S3946]|nr:hypothetical protein H4S03_009642 [Coemansia sp. S3946]
MALRRHGPWATSPLLAVVAHQHLVDRHMAPLLRFPLRRELLEAATAAVLLIAAEAVEDIVADKMAAATAADTAVVAATSFF